jgi:transposase
LRQSLIGYRFYQKLMAEVDVELQVKMQELPRAEQAPEQMPPRTKARYYERASNEPAFDLKGELFRIAGVDLTDVPGISAITAHTIIMEVGPDVSRFRNASAFASWLGLCPEKQVSGGKVLSTRSRKVKNRAAIALRLGAHCLYHAKNYLGDFHRKMKWRLGGPEPVTATAHKLARIVYHLLSTKQPYNESLLVQCDRQESTRAEMRLRKQAANLGYMLSPIPEIL